MSAPLVNLPNSREAYLLYRLEDNRFKSMVALMRWVYQRSNYNNSNEVVFKRLAVWIRNNWSWAVKSYTFNDRRLIIEFSVTGIVSSDQWGVDLDTVIGEEKQLIEFARSKDVF